jgi:hypothetical protein
MAVEADDLSGVVGDQLHSLDAEVGQYLRADAVVAQVVRESELPVRLDRVVACVLERVGLELVQKPNPAALLAHVEEDPRPAGLDCRQRPLHLFPAVAAERVEEVARHALGVDPDQRRRVARDGALHQRQVQRSVNAGAVGDEPEGTVVGGQADLDFAANELLVAAAVGDQVRD